MIHIYKTRKDGEKELEKYKVSLDSHIREGKERGLDFCLVALWDTPYIHGRPQSPPKLSIEAEGIIVRPAGYNFPPKIGKNELLVCLLRQTEYIRQLYGYDWSHDIHLDELVEYHTGKTKKEKEEVSKKMRETAQIYRKWVEEGEKKIIFSESLDRDLAYVVRGHPAFIFYDGGGTFAHQDIVRENPSMLVAEAEGYWRAEPNYKGESGEFAINTTFEDRHFDCLHGKKYFVEKYIIERFEESPDHVVIFRKDKKSF